MDQLHKEEDEWKFCCLNPNHEDSRPSMSFNEKNGFWGCWSCEASGRWYLSLTLLAYCLSNSQTDLNKALCIITDCVIKIENTKVIRRVLKEEIVVPVLESLPQRAIDYLRERGIPKEFVEKKRVGWLTETKRIVIPVNEFWWTARTIGNDLPKYLFPKGGERSAQLYNYELYKDAKEVYVVEGVFDAWKIELAGFSAMATFGSGVTKQQLQKLYHIPKVTIVPDNDRGGEIFAERFSLFCKHRYPLYVISIDKKDIGEYSVQEIKELIPSHEKEFWKVYSRIFTKST